MLSMSLVMSEVNARLTKHHELPHLLMSLTQQNDKWLVHYLYVMLLSFNPVTHHLHAFHGFQHF